MRRLWPPTWGGLALGVLSCAVGLRLIGVWLGYATPVLPNQDEEAEVFRALRYGSGTLDPGLSSWGALSSLVLFCAYGTLYLFGRALRAFDGTADFVGLYLTEPRVFHAIGRSLSALAGSATVWLAWRIARKCSGPLAGVIACLALACMPLPFEFSVMTKCDGLATFLVLAAFAWLLRVRDDPTVVPRARSWLGLGLVVGLGVGTKFHVAALLPGLILGVHEVAKSRWRRSMAEVAMGTVLAFLVANPYLVLHPIEWTTGPYSLFGLLMDADPRKVLAYSRGHVAGFWASGTGGALPGILYGLAIPASVPSKKGPALWIVVSVASFLAAVLARGYGEPHHLLPVLPFVAIAAGIAGERWADRGSHRLALAGVVLLATIPGAYRIGETIAGWRLPDTRVAAKQWIESNLRDGTKLLVDWQYVPNLHRSTADIAAELGGARPVSPQRRKMLEIEGAMKVTPRFRMRILSRQLRSMQDKQEDEAFDLGQYRAEGYEYAVISDAWYGRFFREPLLPEDEHVRTFYTSLKRDFPVLAKFEPEEGKRVGPSIWVVDIR